MNAYQMARKYIGNLKNSRRAAAGVGALVTAGLIAGLGAGPESAPTYKLKEGQMSLEKRGGVLRGTSRDLVFKFNQPEDNSDGVVIDVFYNDKDGSTVRLASGQGFYSDTVSGEVVFRIPKDKVDAHRDALEKTGRVDVSALDTVWEGKEDLGGGKTRRVTSETPRLGMTPTTKAHYLFTDEQIAIPEAYGVVVPIKAERRARAAPAPAIPVSPESPATKPADTSAKPKDTAPEPVPEVTGLGSTEEPEEDKDTFSEFTGRGSHTYKVELKGRTTYVAERKDVPFSYRDDTGSDFMLLGLGDGLATAGVDGEITFKVIIDGEDFGFYKTSAAELSSKGLALVTLPEGRSEPKKVAVEYVTALRTEPVTAAPGPTAGPAPVEPAGPVVSPVDPTELKPGETAGDLVKRLTSLRDRLNTSYLADKAEGLSPADTETHSRDVSGAEYVDGENFDPDLSADYLFVDLERGHSRFGLTLDGKPQGTFTIRPEGGSHVVVLPKDGKRPAKVEVLYIDRGEPSAYTPVADKYKPLLDEARALFRDFRTKQSEATQKTLAELDLKLGVYATGKAREVVDHAKATVTTAGAEDAKALKELPGAVEEAVKKALGEE